MNRLSPRFAVDTRTIAVAFMAWTAAMMWLASWTSPAQAERGRNLSITIVEVAGGRAYITPGERAGLRRGDKVRIGRRRFVVLAAGAESALIETRGRRLRPGQRGQAAVREITETEFTRLTPPRPLSDFEDQWPEATRPASEQTPKPVPLGRTTRRRKRTRILLAAGTTGQIPLMGRPEPLARGFVRARVHAEPLATLPLALDADLAAQLWLSGDLDRRAGGRSRPPARVYALSAQYGDPGGPQGALGRLRYAATGLGALDGLRVQTPLLRDLSLAAFGGLMPGPLD
ncbi:MAG: hypothetical protein OXR73_15090, partial [Myxococcales bacterium]|nr:hypothetical protein [Myxococcales bacterium]